jgi:hypothetical protein
MIDVINPSTNSDQVQVLFYLPTLVAFGVHSTVARRSSRAVRFVGAGVLTVAGFVLSLLIVLSVWGS